MSPILWFSKGRRAQNDEDYETWQEGGIVPTLNAFDNGDIRTTIIVLRMREGKAGGGKGALMSNNRSLTLATGNDQTMFIFYGNRVDDVRLQGEVINTLQARMGTGGNNMPMIAQVNSLTPWPEMGEAMRVYGEDGCSPIVKAHQINVLRDSSVRRLTPRECERLQGFPDDWTAMVSDSSRYKQMGNAVTVPVAQYVFECVLAGLSDA